MKVQVRAFFNNQENLSWQTCNFFYEGSQDSVFFEDSGMEEVFDEEIRNYAHIFGEKVTENNID